MWALSVFPIGFSLFLLSYQSLSVLSWFYVLLLTWCFFLTLLANFWHKEFLNFYLVKYISLLVTHILFTHLLLFKLLELAKLWGLRHSPPDGQVYWSCLTVTTSPEVPPNHLHIQGCFTKKTQICQWKLLFSWSHLLQKNNTN